MSLLYVDVKNHQSISSPAPVKQVLQLTHRKDHNFKQSKFLIDPQKIILNFQPDNSIVEKVIFLNSHTQKISFKIEPPKKNIFSVKCKKSSLNPKQSCQIFLSFAGQKQKIIIQDQFLIIIEKEKLQLHVPILCKPKMLKSLSIRKLSLHKSSFQLKENEIQVKQKIKSKPLVLRKRKTGSLEFNCEIENMVNGFLDKFNSIHEFVKEKNVKKQIFIGEKALSEQKHKHITVFNSKVKKHIEQKIRRKVESRLQAQFIEEGPVIRNFQGLILRWNKEKNIPRLIYEKVLSKVQEQVRKYLVNLRFQKIHRIFSLYREFQKSNEHNNLPKQKKQQIYIERLQKKLNKRSEISLELTFDRNSIIPSQLEVQNDVQSNRKHHVFEINPRIGFDNWIAIEESIAYTHELMDYSKKQGIPEWLCHPKLQDNNLGGVSNRQSNAKILSSEQKDLHQNSSQINSFIQQLKFYQEQQVSTNTDEIESNNTKMKAPIPSRGEIKINQAYNLTSKIFTSMFSNKSIKSSSRDQLKTQSRKTLIDLQLIQNQIIASNLKLILSNSVQSRVFWPYLSLQTNEFTLTDTFIQNEEKIIINELKRPRPNMDYLKGLSFSREQHQTSQQHRLSPLDGVIRYKNQILRKVPKQDKYEFDRLDEKAQHILDMIQKLQEEQQIEKQKLRGEIELEIPNKNKTKTYHSQQVYEQTFQNIKLYKNELLGKSHSLQTYFFQTSKNKYNSIVTI